MKGLYFMIPVHHNFNRYLIENPNDLIRCERWKGRFYKSATISLILIMFAVTVIGAVLLLHHAPALLLSFLIVSATLYKYIRESLILYLQQSGDDAETRAHIYEEMAKNVPQLEDGNVTDHARNLLEETFGFSHQEIDSITIFESFNDSLICRCMGRIIYWHKSEMAARDMEKEIENQIIEQRQRTDTPDIGEEILRLYGEARRVKDDKLLCKISQAYLLYLFKNPEDTRDIARFGCYQRTPYFHTPPYQMRDFYPNCCFFNRTSPLLTLEEVETSSYIDLRKKIFEEERPPTSETSD